MFKKLFGGSSAPKQKAQDAPVDSSRAMEGIENQLENIEKRAKVLENQCRSLKQEALAKKKAKDQRGKIVLLTFCYILIQLIFYINIQ